jgi:hypothetical protein
MAFNPGTIAKALVAGILSGGGAYQVALQDGVVTTNEWVAVAVAALVAGLTTYSVPNAAETASDAEPRHSTEPVQEELPMDYVSRG